MKEYIKQNHSMVISMLIVVSIFAFVAAAMLLFNDTTVPTLML